MHAVCMDRNCRIDPRKDPATLHGYYWVTTLVQDFLQKPFGSADLVGTVRKAMSLPLQQTASLWDI